MGTQCQSTKPGRFTNKTLKEQVVKSSTWNFHVQEFLVSIEGKGVAQSSKIPAIVMYFDWPKVVLSEMFLGVV